MPHFTGLAARPSRRPARRGVLHDRLVTLLRSDGDRDSAACALGALTREYGEVEVRWMLAVIAHDAEASAGQERQVALCL